MFACVNAFLTLKYTWGSQLQFLFGKPEHSCVLKDLPQAVNCSSFPSDTSVRPVLCTQLEEKKAHEINPAGKRDYPKSGSWISNNEACALLSFHEIVCKVTLRKPLALRKESLECVCLSRSLRALSLLLHLTGLEDFCCLDVGISSNHVVLSQATAQNAEKS